MGSKWECPGGKIDPGETPVECLKRELAEEFSIEAQIGPLVCSTTFVLDGDIQLEILAYNAECTSGTITLHEHEEILWVFPEELKFYDLVDSDRTIARKILEKG